MGIQAKVVADTSLTVVMALLSLGMIAILVLLVVNLGRLLNFSYSLLPDFPTSEETLNVLRIVNGALIVIPLAIFLMCAYDIAKIFMNPAKEAAQRAAAAAGGKQGPLKKRPIIFGSLFFVLSAVVVASLAYTGVVLSLMSEYFTTNSVQQELPVPVEKITTLSQVALYTTIVPGLVMVFAIVIVFKAIHEKKSSK